MMRKLGLGKGGSVENAVGVERRTVNPYVTGSSPVRGANFLFSCILANLYLMLIQQVSVKTLLSAF